MARASGDPVTLSIVEAARALGADRARVLDAVHVPLLWPGVATARRRRPPTRHAAPPAPNSGDHSSRSQRAWGGPWATLSSRQGERAGAPAARQRPSGMQAIAVSAGSDAPG